MKFTCTDCALKKVGCVTGEGLTPALIMIVSDRPTLDEVNNKTGFSGKSNEQINSYLTLAEIPLDKVYKTYIVKGYVKSGATVGIVSIRKCVPHLVEEIKLVKPKVIVLLGATAYKGFKGKSGSGTYYYDEEFSAWIVYSFHPMKPIYSGQEDDFMQIVSHFKLAKELVTRNTTQTLAKPNVVVVHTLEELQAVKSTLMVASECGIDCETTGLNLQKDKLLTIGFATKEFVIGVIYRKEMQQDLQDIFNVRKIIGHNLKFDIQVLRSNGLISKNVAADTMLEHYVLEPISTSRDLVSLCLKEFQTTFEKNLDYTTLFVNGITSEIENLLAERGALDAYLSFLLHEKFIARIQADKTMSSFFSNCVMPILDLLCEIEFNGIHIDQNELFSAETVLNYELKAREADILADPVVQHFAQKENLTEINLGSPKQMSTLIYKYLHFPVLREQGRTTAKDVIEKLNETQKNPFITKLLEYRNMSKLRDTYIKGLKEALDRSGEDRVHVQYNQTVVVTGRLSCSAPNLQTIPKAVENAKTIRKMFGARLGYSLVEMDFKQLEFRIWAHLSKDAAMLNMLEAGGDIHRNIAALLNGVAEPQVTDSQRYQAKEICFGLIYGMGVTTMSDRTGITVEEATRIKNDFFSTFPEATIWIKQVQDFGLKHKYVLTPFGRKIPIVYNPNDKEQIASAQRHAVNYPIQSTGGDLTNITGVYLKKLMITEGINAKIVLNVHDSLVWEVKDEEIVKFKPVALEAIKMISDKINFRAFLQASFTQGKNLGELVEL
jgi:DNA polymerase-1